MLNINQVYFYYDHKKIISNCSLSVPSGFGLHLSGPNGSGKTTLLKLMAGLLLPAEGFIHYHNTNIFSVESGYFNDLQFIGYEEGYSPFLQVSEVLTYEYGIKSVEKSDELLKKVDLLKVKSQSVKKISSGQKKRLSLLRLLTKPAKIWILDEPFVALDAAGISWLSSLISTHLNEGGSVIFSAHSELFNINSNITSWSLC